jgi:hypothetical protein
MNRCTFRSVLAGAVIGLAGATSHAATLAAVPETGGNFSIFYKGATQNLHIDPSATLSSPIYFYDGNLTPQNPATIQQALVDAFPQLTSTSQISLVGACDNGANCGTSSSVSNSTGFRVNTTSAFDYLAIHLGGGELFFHWNAPVTSALLSGLDTGSISNFRAFTSGVVSSVPIPGALGLFLSALGVLGIGRGLKGRQDAKVA